MAADEQGGGEVVKLHKHAGKTPQARARQRANLKPQSAIRHGAYSAELLKPERERILGEMLVSFPNVRRDRLEIAAAQRARITLLTNYIEARGIIAHRGRGSTFPAVDRLQREETAYRAELTRIEDLHREAGAKPGDVQTLLRAMRADADGDAEGES